ncbi:MAG: hypothetical protein ACE5GE_14000 [Phycisphaerae bacterium]
MSEPVVAVCPNCMQKYRVVSQNLGRRALCKRCGQRFKIAVEHPIDDDTICGWIAEADPAGHSVMGGTSIFGARAPGEKPSGAQWHRPHPPETPRVEFARLDRGAAIFEFPSSRLEDADLRCSFPHRCVHCLSPKELSMHYVIWDEKLPRHETLRLQEEEMRMVRSLDKLIEADPQGWFDGLEPIVVLPGPFDEPMPYFVCHECGAIGEVTGRVLQADETEVCHLRIANLTIALDFFRNNGGKGQPGYQRILVARRQAKGKQWENLPYAVRERLSQWFTRQTDEKFMGFYADDDFSRADAGLAGVVLTDRRLVFKKYGGCREYSVQQGGRIHVQANENRANVEIFQEGKDDAACTTRPLAAGALIRTLGELVGQWDVAVDTNGTVV